jgi:hypothetical protein
MTTLHDSSILLGTEAAANIRYDTCRIASNLTRAVDFDLVASLAGKMNFFNFFPPFLIHSHTFFWQPQNDSQWYNADQYFVNTQMKLSTELKFSTTFFLLSLSCSNIKFISTLSRFSLVIGLIKGFKLRKFYSVVCAFI